ncbi:MAG: hypothetical protein CML16_03265 [Pusillimonas sp.]|nr:hypothetical protein [Pusillimonas sp.]MBC43607.1 hypothetical protein [Pusillimonas sp.]HCP79392.1 hypothetical protein [Pusillimonas sp.]|tara:strand:+ start:30 stop:458 length:429 start_codon:yes stop_codon:yes gene_type:complete
MSAPIIEAEFSLGVKVVDIGDLRVARGLTRREHSACKHIQLVYDSKERRVWCKDCETDVEAFDAFTSLVERFYAFENRISRLREIEAETLHSRAAKALDKVFRSRTMTPRCPHCNRGILAEDVVNGVSSMSRDLELRRRSKT